MPEYSFVPADIRFPVSEMTPENLFEEFLFADAITSSLDEQKVNAIAEEGVEGTNLELVKNARKGYSYYIRTAFTISSSDTGMYISPVFYVPESTLYFTSKQNIPERAATLLNYVNQRATAAYRDGIIIRDNH